MSSLNQIAAALPPVFLNDRPDLRSALGAAVRETVLAGAETLTVESSPEARFRWTKAALEKLFPGCKVVVNSDLVATERLAALARSADLFVFAWKSSSHQAFYCVKDAITNGEPIWVPGKGTASILRAVLDYLAGMTDQYCLLKSSERG